MASILGIEIIVFINLCLLYYICANCNALFAMRNFSWGYCLGVHSQHLSLSYHDCNFLCIQKTTCAATNYMNDTEGRVCSLLLNPCHQLSAVQHMTYTFYTSVDRDQCLEWVNYNQGMVADEQWALTRPGGDDGNRVLARLLYAGTYYPGYFSPYHSICFGAKWHVRFDTRSGILCQILRVREGCVTAFVSYTAGDILPTGVVTGGSMSDGRKNYIAVYQVPGRPTKSVGGFYTEGTTFGVGTYGPIQRVTEMELLIVV